MERTTAASSTTSSSTCTAAAFLPLSWHSMVAVVEDDHENDEEEEEEEERRGVVIEDEEEEEEAGEGGGGAVASSSRRNRGNANNAPSTILVEDGELRPRQRGEEEEEGRGDAARDSSSTPSFPTATKTRATVTATAGTTIAGTPTKPSSPTSPSSSSSHETRRSRIAFGSCNNQDLVNNLWDVIHAREPAAFVWGGDAIYADQKVPMDWSQFPPKIPTVKCAHPGRLRRLYRQQRANPGYRQLLRQNITIFGTYDDHDYGCNNADHTYPYRNESLKLFANEFLRLSPRGGGGMRSPFSAMSRRANEGHGMYGVALFDFARPVGRELVPEWEARIDPDALADLEDDDEDDDAPPAMIPPLPYSNRSVAVFALDIRSNKSPWRTGAAAYLGRDAEGDFLGERQWSWFESALRNSRASVNVVVSGLQVHANRFPDGNVAEAWDKFPRSQRRLFDALLQEGVSTPMLVSGDVHMSEFMRKDCVRRGSMPTTTTNPNAAPGRRRRRQQQPVYVRPLMEMTTSGMTHSWGTPPNKPLDHVVAGTHRDDGDGILHSGRTTTKHASPSWTQRYISWVLAHSMHMVHHTLPWTDLMYADSPAVADDGEGERAPAAAFLDGGGENARTGLQFTLLKNFGEMEFDWDAGTVTMRVIGEHRGDPRPAAVAAASPADAPILLSATRPIEYATPSSSEAPWTIPSSHLTPSDFADDGSSSEWICVNHRGPDSQIRQTFAHVLSLGVVGAWLTLPVWLPAATTTILLLLYCGRRRRRRSTNNNKQQQRQLQQQQHRTTTVPTKESKMKSL